MVLFNEENDERLNLKKQGLDRLASSENQKVTHFKKRIGGKNFDLKLKKQQYETKLQKKKENQENELEEDKNNEEDDKYNKTQTAKSQTIGNKFNFQPNYSDLITKEQTNNEIIQYTPLIEEEQLIAIKTLDTNTKINNNNTVLNSNPKELVNQQSIDNRNCKKNNIDQNYYPIQPYESLPNHFMKKKMTHKIMRSPPIMRTPPIENPEMYIDKRYANPNEFDEFPNEMRYDHNPRYYQDQPQNIITDFYSDPPSGNPSDYNYFQYPPIINRAPEMNQTSFYRKFPTTLSPSSHDETLRGYKDNEYYLINPNSQKYLSQKTYRKEPIYLDYPDPKLVKPQIYQTTISHQQQLIPPYYEANDIEYFEAQQMRQTRISPTQRRPPALHNYNNGNSNDHIETNIIQKTYSQNHNGDNVKKSPQTHKAFFNWLSNPKNQ